METHPRGLARVVVGTRSAVFAPVQDLGLLIIDEEQEDTYKSESTPRYHARDVAKFRCAQHRALLLLGSATPDVVSRYYAETGRYHYFTLPDRFNARKLPDVIIADMKQELRNGNSGSISSMLYGELEENLRRGEQSILFLNRRGASKIVTCAECGATYSCPNCSVSLTYHQGNQMLICHHCGYRRRSIRSARSAAASCAFSATGRSASRRISTRCSPAWRRCAWMPTPSPWPARTRRCCSALRASASPS